VIFLLFQKDARERKKAAGTLKAAEAWLAEFEQQRKELKVNRDTLAKGMCTPAPMH